MKAATRGSRPNPFRELSHEEIGAITEWTKRGKLAEDIILLAVDQISKGNIGGPVRVSYHRTQGGFTVCTLSECYNHPTRGTSHEIRTGSSRRSFKDPHNPIKGEMLALFRAINSHPVTLP